MLFIKKQAKAIEHTENGVNIEQNDSAETVEEIDEEVTKKSESVQRRAGRPKRGGGAAPGMA